MASALSPVAVVAAIVFSYLGFTNSQSALKLSQQTLETSQQSLKVGQRAYVAIERSRLAASNDPDLQLRNGVKVTLLCDIRNLGRTPATIERVEFTFQLPPGWKAISDRALEISTDSKRESVWVVTDMPNIRVGQDQIVAYRYNLLFELTDEGFRMFRDLIGQNQQLTRRHNRGGSVFAQITAPSNTVTVSTMMDYRDVFKDWYSLTWTSSASVP